MRSSLAFERRRFDSRRHRRLKLIQLSLSDAHATESEISFGDIEGSAADNMDEWIKYTKVKDLIEWEAARAADIGCQLIENCGLPPVVGPRESITVGARSPPLLWESGFVAALVAAAAAGSVLIVTFEAGGRSYVKDELYPAPKPSSSPVRLLFYWIFHMSDLHHQAKWFKATTLGPNNRIAL